MTASSRASASQNSMTTAAKSWTVHPACPATGLAPKPGRSGRTIRIRPVIAASSQLERWDGASDPGAEGFYLGLGAERVGMSPSTLLPGRSIPLMRYAL